MAAIPPIEFLRYLVDQGHEFNVGFLEHGEISEEYVHVRKDNFEKFAERMEEKS